MRRRGINYDAGFAPFGNQLSRPSFEAAQVRRELAVIARDLHCNAVRITARDTARLLLAADCARAEGLEVWFSPFPSNLKPEELLPYFDESARAAETLRGLAGEIVFVLGCELTMFNAGFIPGASYGERLQHLMSPAARGADSPEALVERFQSFLGRALATVRARFKGPVTYASGPWEPVDWSGFDLVSVDLYRDATNRSTYREQLRNYGRHGRPVVVTELGCCTFRGAPDRGALGWTIVDRAARPPRLREPVVRDEQAQAAHVTEMLTLLDEERVDGAFWYTFASYGYPHREDPRLDLDCASYGVVKILDGHTGTTVPGMPWEPKRAFVALAERYAEAATRS